MIKKPIFCVLICLFCKILSAQSIESFTVKGIVKEITSNDVVPYVTVSIADTSSAENFLKRFATDVNGKFSEDIKLAKGDYFISFDAFTLETKKLPLTLVDEKKIDLGEIFLEGKSTELSTVEITATKPLVTQDLDKIGYDVESDPDSKTSTAMEMLRKVPLVTIDHEDNIQIKGSSSFKIYINGKPSNMITKNPKDVLKSMPASSIKKVEVITDPGAKYDAEGVTAILNIVTQSAIQGFQGSIRASYSTNNTFGAGGYISAKVGKFGVTANYNYNQYASPWWSNSKQENFDISMPYQFSISNSEGKYKGGYNYGNLELSYEFDTLNLLSASFGVNGGRTKSPDGISRTTKLDWDGDTVSAYHSIGNSRNSYIGFSGNIDYQRTFKKPEQLLTFSYLFDLSPDNSENVSIVKVDTNFSNILNTKETNQKFIKRGNTDEHTFQIDYTEPFRDGKHVIAGGWKYILRMNKADNGYQIYDDLSQEYDMDTSRLENDMLYYQHIFGAYASYSFKLKKFSLRVGGRMEGTLQDVKFLDKEQDNFKVAFFNLIPSISLNYKPDDKSSLRLSYNNGISRPSIWYLNPYVDDGNQYAISYGNPDLKAERSHNLTFSYGFVTQKFNINVSTSYSQVNNSIEDYTFVDSNGIVNSTYANIGKYQRASVNLYMNYNPWKWLRVWLQSNVAYSLYRNNNYSYGNYRVEAYGGANFTLPWKIKLNLNGGGATPWAGYQNRGASWYYYSFQLQRSFLKGDALTVSIFAQSPFEKYKNFQGKSWSPEVYENNYTSKQLGRVFGISLSWRFGEMKAEIKKAERSISNDDVKSGGGGGSQGGGQ